MRDKKAELIAESLSSAMPYVSHPEELREIIQREEKTCDRIEEFIDSFKRRNSEIADPTRRTDGRIFLNELKRNLVKDTSD